MKKTLLFVGLSVLSFLVMGQKTDKDVKSKRISDFKKRIYLSTSKDPLAITKVKTIKAKELAAQELVATQTIKKSNLKAVIVAKPEIDTTYTYPWDETSQQWDTVPFARMLSYYDAQHNLIQYIAFSWNYNTQSWQDSLQFFYKYNNANQIVNIVQQSWQFDGISNYSWVNIDHCIYEYNELGQESKFTYQYWDCGDNNWDDIWRHEFTYDSIGNNTLILETDWDGSEWAPGINFIYKYNTINHVTLNLIQVWDNDSNVWTDAFQYIYDYDSLGNNDSMLLQTWDPDEGLWDNCILETINYYSSNKIDNYLFQLWDDFLYEWDDVERGFYKYDSSGNNICILGQDYDQSTNTWSNSCEYLYEYNAQNKQISNSVLYWDDGIENWYFGMKTKNLKITNPITAKQLVAANALEVYPNPANEFVNIRNSSDIVSIQMFDILGNEILVKNNISSNNFQLDIANFKSGAYFLNIKDSKGASLTRKIIKR
jgi:hypothetical protein